MSLAESGRARLDSFLRGGIQTWQREGRITAEQSASLGKSLDTPEVEHALMHGAAHFAISLPLRYPFGALSRFFYTLGLRLRAEALGLLRRGSPREDRRTHTLLVMLVALTPGFGRLAYFFSPALASHRLLLVIPIDQIARKLPARSYDRFHLDALFVYWADTLGAAGAKVSTGKPLLSRARERLRGLAEYARWLVLVVSLDAVAFGIGAWLYVDSDRTSTWWFEERSVIATIDAVQLLVAAFAGRAAYLLFWRAVRQPSKADAAGIFFWGIGGLGLLLFAVDDYFTLHENLGDLLYGAFPFLPEFTNEVDDMLILVYMAGGLAMMVMFQMDLRAHRASTTLLYLAAVSSVIMVLSDAFAKTEALEAIELPAQTLAVTLLMFAFIARYREVKVHAAPADAAPAAGVTP